MVLNGSYTAIRGNILVMTPFPTMSQAYLLLVQEERQRQIKIETHFLNKKSPLSTATNRKPSQLDTWKPNQRKTDIRRSQLYCDHCKRCGYTTDKCFKIHGYPNRPQGRGRGSHGLPQRRWVYSIWIEND